MKVLITGSSGDIGRVCSRFLIQRKIFVTGLDIRDGTERFSDKYFRFYKCCITDKARLESVFREERPTHVLHFACSFNRIRSRKKEFDIDVSGSENVLEAANKVPSVRQLIYSSSASAYGGNPDNRLWLSEDDPLRPGYYRYGVNKTVIEKLFSQAQLREDLRLIMVRICIVVGPSFSKDNNIVSIIDQLPLFPKFCMKNKIQFIHEDDLCSLLYLLMSDQNARGIFNLTNETYSEISELRNGKGCVPIPVGLVKSILWVMWNMKVLNLEPAGIDQSIYPIILDSSKLTSRYNYKFKYSTYAAFQEAVRNNRSFSN